MCAYPLLLLVLEEVWKRLWVVAVLVRGCVALKCSAGFAWYTFWFWRSFLCVFAKKGGVFDEFGGAFDEFGRRAGATGAAAAGLGAYGRI